MIPVEQRFLATVDEHGDTITRGDCLSACVASIFELPLESVPFFVESRDWYRSYHDFIESLGFAVGAVRISIDENDPTTLDGYPSEGIYWIAGVKSPRFRVRCLSCKGAGCEWCDVGLRPGLHSVVMCSKEIVWDPHPQRDMGHLGFVSGEWFIAPDPARLTLRGSSPFELARSFGGGFIPTPTTRIMGVDAPDLGDPIGAAE